jgi:hypothetical protein
MQQTPFGAYVTHAEYEESLQWLLECAEEQFRAIERKTYAAREAAIALRSGIEVTLGFRPK